MKISATSQRNGVSEGFALGLLMNNVNSIGSEKVSIDLAFASAWRGWPYCDRFPQVNTDLRNGTDEIWVATRADEKKRTFNLFWDLDSDGYSIYHRGLWEREDAYDFDFIASQVPGEVPAKGWGDLAGAFLSVLRP